ncbi:hypothetical protein PT282_04415 [Bifidobacterium sp. ESL0763]|uniref:hypothetical protein n=1 Tax=Bifidobacterium sp. ESL0763 TaxID=2983227 RepID=UPI0023F75A61|nr:hypothetical protein [Bifidobacterium sp. ESL0763]MDF7663906.1 hypothetical protein [Bifidobacterium sp. ESL0763]
MRHNKHIETMLDRAQCAHSCLACGASPEYRALHRRYKCGELLSPYPCVFVRESFWNSLNPIEQDLATIRALAQLHPNWIFTGLSAASVHGLDHSYALHRLHHIHIATDTGQGAHNHARLERVYLHHPHIESVEMINVTDIPQTLVVLARRLPFRDALALFDSASRKGTGKTAILEACRTMRCDKTDINRLIDEMNPLSENSGESLARATMIELGFIVPRLQVPFPNSDPSRQPYRVDFAWRLPDNRCIVGEYDGMQKYVMQSAGGRTYIEAKVHQQLRREEDLKRQGVDDIIRFQYEDLLRPARLAGKLVAAGIPRCR